MGHEVADSGMLVAVVVAWCAAVWGMLRGKVCVVYCFVVAWKEAQWGVGREAGCGHCTSQGVGLLVCHAWNQDTASVFHEVIWVSKWCLKLHAQVAAARGIRGAISAVAL